MAQTSLLYGLALLKQKTGMQHGMVQMGCIKFAHARVADNVLKTLTTNHSWIAEVLSGLDRTELRHGFFSSLFWFGSVMTMSEVTPAEWRKHCFAWGLAFLGLPALFSPLLLRAERVAAEQYSAMADANTAAIAGGAVAAKLPLTYSIRVIKQSPDRLKLRGTVATKEDHKALLGLVKANFPSADVSDRIKVADGPKTEMKLGGISFALKALTYLQAGAAKIDDQGVALSGDTESRAIYSELRSLIDSGKPTGLVVQDDVAIPQTAFSWRAEFGDGQVKLTGAVRDGADRKQLEATVQKLFSGLHIVDNTYSVEGTPESWVDAAMHSLEVLRLLNSGFVVLADHSISVEGHASNDEALKLIDKLADKYPAGFALESKVSIPPAQAGMFGLIPYAAAVSLQAIQDSEPKGIAADLAAEVAGP